MEIWDLWFPQAAASGLPFARSRIDPAEVVLVHAAPRSLSIEVRSEAGSRVAFGDRLARAGAYYPMTRLRRTGGDLVREDGWPDAADIGRTVILAGGEAGTLTDWWNAEDGSEWRWSVEFYNHR
jgi:ABC-type phosphate/phosphonate transport system substrate-binding protein